MHYRCLQCSLHRTERRKKHDNDNTVSSYNLYILCMYHHARLQASSQYLHVVHVKANIIFTSRTFISQSHQSPHQPRCPRYMQYTVNSCRSPNRSPSGRSKVYSLAFNPSIRAEKALTHLDSDNPLIINHYPIRHDWLHLNHLCIRQSGHYVFLPYSSFRKHRRELSCRH